MREMKNSGIDWIGLIPKDWSICKVKNIFYRKNEKANNPEPVVLSLARSGVKVRDITNGEGQLAENYSNYNPVTVDDLLLNPMDLYSGANCSVSKVEGVISPAYINLKAIGNNNSTYYDYYFKTQYWSMVLFAHGKGVSFDNRWTLNTETLMNYYLPWPTTREQEKIANFLNEKVQEIDNAIEKTKETIEDYKKLKKSIIATVVIKGLDYNVEMKESGFDWIGEIPSTWIAKKFKYIGKFINGYAFPSSDFTSKGIKVLKITNIQPMQMNYSEFSYVDEKYKTLDNFRVKKGALVFALTRPIINGGIKAAIVEKDDFMLLNQRNAMFYGNSKVDTKWLFYMMLNEKFIEQFELCIDKTGQQPNISTNDIQNIGIVLPPLNEQKKIINFLDNKCSEIDSLIKSKEKIVEELESYKKSVIYEYVTGKKEVK